MKPYTEAKYNELADAHFREVVEHHGDRAEVIRWMKQIDRALSANGRGKK